MVQLSKEKCKVIGSNEIFNATIDEKPYTCISIGPREIDLPSYLMQGEKPCGYIIKNQKLEKWFWKGLSIVHDKRCLYFEPIALYPITDIATNKRSNALVLVRELAQALMLLPSKFLNLTSGILPLWRIWGIEDGGFLILPQSLADLLSSCADEETRFAQSSCYVHHGIHAPFSLCDQLVQLLYLSAVGFPPFADKRTREDSFRALPVSLCDLELPKKTIGFIDDSLKLSLTKQRDGSGNKESQIALSWFLTQTESLQWTLKNKQTSTTHAEREAQQQSASFLANQEKRANRKIFWRNKGWIVISVTALVIALAWFTTSRIKIALTPPYTAGMTHIEVIEEFFAGQNSLDLQKMEASLSKKAKNPASMEVTNLFVTRQTRQAYEGIDTQIDPNEWITQGKPPILAGTFIYGVTDVKIKQIEENTYEVTSTLYTPYTYFEDEEKPMLEENTAAIYLYEQVQSFSVEMGKRGWLEITSINNLGIKELGHLMVPTYIALDTKISGMPQ